MIYNKEDRGKSGIYVIRNKINGKVYVGKSIDIDQRIRAHVTQLNTKSKDENRHLINSWHKHGRDCFEYDVLEYTPLDINILKERELYWMVKLKATTRHIGYNLRMDSSSSMIVHEDTRKLQSINMKRRYEEDPNLRITSGEKTRTFWKENEEIKNSMKVKVSKNHTKFTIVQFTREMEFVNEFESGLYMRQNHPELYLPAILQVCNGNKASYNGFFWRYKCVKTGEIQFQKDRRPMKRIVLMFDKQSNELLQEFNSATEAANFIGQKTPTNVSKYCIYKTSPKTHSFYFRYKHDIEDIVQPQ